MIQLEFQTIRTMFAAAGAMLRRPLPKATQVSAINYTLKLSAALRVYNLTHQLHDVLCAVAKQESERGYATIPSVTMELACTYNNVSLHLLRNADMFLEDASHKPRRLRLSPEALRLMHKIKRRTS